MLWSEIPAEIRGDIVAAARTDLTARLTRSRNRIDMLEAMAARGDNDYATREFAATADRIVRLGRALTALARLPIT